MKKNNQKVFLPQTLKPIDIQEEKGYAEKDSLNNGIEEQQLILRGEEIASLLRQKGLQSPIVNVQLEKERQTKVEAIKYHFQKILQALELDTTDPGLHETPLRVAKLYVDELCSGLNPDQFPKCTTFPMQESSIVFQKDIPFSSLCMHHFLPFTGHVHIGYKSNGKILGLSKLNRVVNYFSRRPQVQELLNKQIYTVLQAILDTEDVFVRIEGSHSCIHVRGVNQQGTKTISQEAGGVFKDPVYLGQYFHKM
ncbi:hypothetical protein FGO68_gene5938 [Halteria grandinella]|uniref:GTP cyclohydrolase 1 n=1 Tax=Halteria grandinella TaxID=5974 RepID=A0A8J8SZF2_HALGN|nr:hypothetical protein FGO68_gene5938 [Halteria grandinella]